MSYESSGRTSLLEPRSLETTCPYCHATTVAASIKRSSANYSRCDVCGQVWHPDRVGARPRSRFNT